MGQGLYTRDSEVDSTYSLDVTPGNHAAPTVGISGRASSPIDNYLD